MGRLLALLCMSLFCGSALAEIQRVLPERVQRVLDAYDMPPASYSAWVQAIGQNEPLLALNEDLPRNPASTIKLLTTFLALEDLGRKTIEVVAREPGVYRLRASGPHGLTAESNPLVVSPCLPQRVTTIIPF